MASPERPPRPLKLLLDVHHSPVVADRLRTEGHDVEAAAADPGLRVLSDEDLLRHASGIGRVVVTKNVRDFDQIARSWPASDEHHAGIVFTSPRRFHRGSVAYPENLIGALQAIPADPPEDTTDWVFWLP